MRFRPGDILVTHYLLETLIVTEIRDDGLKLFCSYSYIDPARQLTLHTAMATLETHAGLLTSIFREAFHEV